jgi:hypothetical protein
MCERQKGEHGQRRTREKTKTHTNSYTTGPNWAGRSLNLISRSRVHALLWPAADGDRWLTGNFKW